MRVAATERFTQTVDDYDKHRPSYPDAAIDWIVETSRIPAHGAIVDLGCGTGISARLFFSRGFRVTGVDPNEAMLARAKERGGDITWLRGEASATTLPSDTFDLAIAAQAFHWFDVPRALAEIDRICKKSGAAAAFWNGRAHTPAMDAYEAFLLAESKEYGNLKTFDRTLEELQAAIGPRARQASFPNAQLFDWEGFRGRVFSSSYVVHGVDDKEAFEAKLRALFDVWSQGGRLEFVYSTKIILWPIDR